MRSDLAPTDRHQTAAYGGDFFLAPSSRIRGVKKCRDAGGTGLVHACARTFRGAVTGLKGMRGRVAK